MKRFLIYSILSFTLTIVSYKQTIAQESACHRDWGFWENVYTSDANINFRISFKLPKTNEEVCQFIYYRFQNLFAIPEAYLMFKVDYKTSDNKIKTYSFTYIKLDRTGVFTESGNFLVGSQVIRIYDVVYKELPGKKKSDAALIPASSIERTKALLNNPSQQKVPSGVRTPEIGRRAENTNTNSTVEILAETNNSQNQQNQKYQSAADNYLNTAKNSDGGINRAMNMDMAKINAQAAGNTAQVAQIQRMQNQQTVEDISKVGNEVVNYLNSLSEAKARKEASQRKTQEIYRQREIEDKNRREENMRQVELERQQIIANQWVMDQVLLNNFITRKPNLEIPEKIKKVFFITYERFRNDNSFGSLKLNTYTVNRYSDDTWIMQDDIAKKLKFSEVTHDTNTTKLLLGFFVSKEEVSGLIMQIKTYFDVKNVSIDDSFIELNNEVNTAIKKDGFWNN